MKKIPYLLFVMILVATFALMGINVNYVAHAEGTVPCLTTNSEVVPEEMAICSASVDIPGLPVEATGWITEITNPGLILPLPQDEHPVGAGADVYILDKAGAPVIWVVPPIKICFPVTPLDQAIVRRWVTPAELATWYPGQTFAEGVWVAIPTTYENGMTCGSSYRLPGPFAVFDANEYFHIRGGVGAFLPHR